MQLILQRILLQSQARCHVIRFHHWCFFVHSDILLKTPVGIEVLSWLALKIRYKAL